VYSIKYFKMWMKIGLLACCHLRASQSSGLTLSKKMEDVVSH
jgi:hypothetical protein